MSNKYWTDKTDGVDEISAKDFNDAFDGLGKDIESGTEGLTSHKAAEVLDHPDGSVTTEKLADGSVTAEKIADGTVTADKLGQDTKSDWNQNDSTQKNYIKNRPAIRQGTGNYTIAQRTPKEMNEAAGDYSAAFNCYTRAKAMRSAAFGNNTEVAEEAASGMATGESSVVKGKNGFAGGNLGIVDGENGFAVNDHNYAGGANTAVFGQGNKALQDNLFVCGQYNASLPDDQEPLFIIGNGTGDDSADRKNALIVYKDGHIWMNSDLFICEGGGRFINQKDIQTDLMPTIEQFQSALTEGNERLTALETQFGMGLDNILSVQNTIINGGDTE